MLKLRWQLAVMVPFVVIVTVKGMNWVESWEPVEYGICDWLAAVATTRKCPEWRSLFLGTRW